MFPCSACQSNAVSVEDAVMYNDFLGQRSPVAAFCVDRRCTAKYTASTCANLNYAGCSCADNQGDVFVTCT